MILKPTYCQHIIQSLKSDLTIADILILGMVLNITLFLRTLWSVYGCHLEYNCGIEEIDKQE